MTVRRSDERSRDEFGAASRVRVAWAMTLLLIASLEFTASYRGIVVVLAVAVAALAPFGLVRLGQLAKGGTIAPALVVIVLSALAGWLVLRRAGADDATLGGVGDAVPRLLTTPRPAPATAALLTPTVLLVVLVATVVAACVLVPGEPDARPRGLLAPVLGAAGLYTAAQLLAAGGADRYGLVAAALLAIAAAGWSFPIRRGDGRAWQPATGVPLVAVVVLALGVATFASAQPFDPRRHVSPPVVRLDEASPLTQLGSWAANPSVRILQTNASGTGRLHLATLDTFTGSAWQVKARYQQLGLVSSGDLPAGKRTAKAKATVRVLRLGGIWLPAPGVATSSSLSDVLIDPDDGTLARPSHARPGLTYDIDARVNAPTGKQLQVARTSADVPKRYLDLPNLPAGFVTYARKAVRGASNPFEEAVALEDAVSSGRRIEPTAPTGSSYSRLETFLFAKRGVAGAQVGTEEQFAASFAVLARAVGLPSRLTVGFLLGKPAANGTVTVRGRDATVWPEIYLQDVGWVPFAPSPDATGSAAGDKLRDDVLQKLSDRDRDLPVPDPPVKANPSAAPGATNPGTTGERATPARADESLPVWALVVIAVVAAGLLIVLGVVVLLVRRRRRHRALGARGAWAEVVDQLVLLGRRPPPGRPAPEVAADAAEVLGTDGIAAKVASAADREAFAPSTPETPTDVWREVRVLRRRARATMPRYRRVLAPVDPRPLLRR